MSAAHHRQTAAAWHTGDSSLLYAYATTGEVRVGLDAEIEHRLAMVDHATAMNTVDRIDERERLLSLLHHVEPLLAEARAGTVGHEHGRLASVWWRQDNLHGRSASDALETAQRTLQRIDEARDPQALGISPGWDNIDDPREIADAAGLREPREGDIAAHERWETTLGSVCDAYTEAFAHAFWGAVAEECRNELDITGSLLAAAPARVSEHHLAYARLAGAESALATASALDLDPWAAAAVTTGAWHRFEPPTPPGSMAAGHTSGHRSGETNAGALAAVGEAGAATRGAIHADVIAAWLDGRGTMWVTALWAKALHTLGYEQLARRLDNVCGDRLGDLVEALDAARSEPVTPTAPADPEPGAPVRAALSRLDRRVATSDGPGVGPGADTPTRGVEP